MSATDDSFARTLGRGRGHIPADLRDPLTTRRLLDRDGGLRDALRAYRPVRHGLADGAYRHAGLLLAAALIDDAVDAHRAVLRARMRAVALRPHWMTHVLASDGLLHVVPRAERCADSAALRDANPAAACGQRSLLAPWTLVNRGAWTDALNRPDRTGPHLHACPACADRGPQVPDCEPGDADRPLPGPAWRAARSAAHTRRADIRRELAAGADPAQLTRAVTAALDDRADAWAARRLAANTDALMLRALRANGAGAVAADDARLAAQAQRIGTMGIAAGRWEALLRTHRERPTAQAWAEALTTLTS